MKISSWNVNSIRARTANIGKWLDETAPDIACLQELKAQEEQVPTEIFSERGYEYALACQKSYNGVALISKHPMTDILIGLPGDDTDTQARFVEATICPEGQQPFRIAALYLPNGNPVGTEKYDYKLAWMERLYHHVIAQLNSHDLPYILAGDFNIIPFDTDCWDPKLWATDALFKLESRQKFRAIEHLGMYDAFKALNPTEIEPWTFWDYQAGRWPRNEGIRIDHFLMNGKALDLTEKCWIEREPRSWEKASDHTPILAKLNLQES